MRAAAFVFAGCVCLALAGTPAAQAAARHAIAAPPARTHYFLDFRARPGTYVGHTFIAYGRVDAGGRVLEERHAGHYPHDDLSESLLLMAFAVPGYVSVKKENPSQPPIAVYRRWLNPAGYARLRATVRRLRAGHLWWHIVFYNCNGFAAQVAQEMGLRTPLTLDVPAAWVRGLRQLNGP
jgi:hypothetical protein